jgi:xanthine dehydrogenase YagT iron-sulfur-binding subunit
VLGRLEEHGRKSSKDVMAPETGEGNRLAQSWHAAGMQRSRWPCAVLSARRIGMSSDLTRRDVLKVSVAAAVAPLLPVLDNELAAAHLAGPGPSSRTARRVQFSLNGAAVARWVEPRVTLLDLLREQLHVTGPKKGCNEGACGACTVLVDGASMNGCLMLAVQAEGRQITTVEGLASADGSLHPVQQAFIDHDAFQCGFCTSGQILSALACIRARRASTAEEVREFMSGNLCRCSSYPQITAAVLDARGKLEG